MIKKVFPLILILISVVGFFFFRFYYWSLPALDKVAAKEVYEAQTSAIKKSVQEKYPGIHPLSEVKITDALFKDRLKNAKLELNAKIDQRASELKKRYRDERGDLYLLGIDSYYWLRLLNNLLKTGHIGDRVVNGIEYDDLIANPIDAATKKNIHLWLGFVAYKITSFFVRNIPLEQVLFYIIPLFLSAVIAIFSFYLTRRLGANDIGAFFASIAINFSPFLIMRISGETFDTDIYNVLFPLLAFGTFVYAFNHKKISQRIFLSALSGLFLAFYASTWKGWWFIFDIMILSGLLFILNQKTIQEDEGLSNTLIKEQLASIGIFFLCSTFFVIVINGFSVWFDFILEPLRLSSVLKVTPQALWPNVFLTVAELEPVNPFNIVALLGGNFIFFSAMFGLIYILLYERGIRDNRFGFGILCLALWLLWTFYSALHAIRFVLLIVVPLGIVFGLAYTKFYNFLCKIVEKYLTRRPALIFRSLAIFLIAFPFLFNSFSNCNKYMSVVPELNDEWYYALKKINRDTPQKAIINSWWDFGHWFKAIGQRRVLFDGMTQNTPYAYWMANVLLADDEDEALGILRMINASDNKAVDALMQKADTATATAVEIIRKALKMKKEDARNYLKERVSEGKVDEILSYIFPAELPPAYFVVSYDMPTKISAISYIGNWDFKKVDMWFKLKKERLSKSDFVTHCLKKYNLSPQEAEVKFSEIMLFNDEEAKTWFSYILAYPMKSSPSQEDDKVLFFDNGLVVNLENNHARIISEYEQKNGIPKSLIFFENGLYQESPQKDSDLDVSALLFKEDAEYKGLLVDPSLAKSMLVRLYFLKGEGLKFFKLYHKEEDENGNAIYIYEVRWPEANKK